MGIFGDQLNDGAVPESKLSSAVQSKLNAGSGGSVVLEDKTADFTVTASDEGKIFTNIGSSGTVRATADSGLSNGFNFYLMRVENNSFQFAPESGGRVAGNAPTPSSPWLAADAVVEIVNQVVMSHFIKTSSGWVILPDASNISELVTAEVIQLGRLAEVGTEGVDGLSFSNGVGNTGWKFSVLGVNEDGEETGRNFGSLSEATGYTPGDSQPPPFDWVLVKVEVTGGAGPGGELAAEVDEFSIEVADGNATGPFPVTINPRPPGVSGGFFIADGRGMYVNVANGDAYEAVFGSGPTGQWPAPGDFTSLDPVPLY